VRSFEPKRPVRGHLTYFVILMITVRFFCTDLQLNLRKSAGNTCGDVLYSNARGLIFSDNASCMKYLPAQALPMRCHAAFLIGCVAQAMLSLRALPDREMAAT